MEFPHAHFFENKKYICYFKIIIKVVLISKMILFMVVLHSCTIFIFHCIEKIRGGCWGTLTFSVHMAPEVLNPSHDSKVCSRCYKSEKIFNQHSNEQSQGNANTRAAGKDWAWIKFSVSVDVYNNKKIKSTGTVDTSGWFIIYSHIFSCFVK